ncbi:MAG: translation initiation factor IF-2 N-terminal domain-containing protein, partial [Eubacterium sp.]|nr:translation initiation factor IF-2 N-terminal domain-containing protein [Eubacterium sp.]
MVVKMRVSDVAKDFGKTNKEIINILSDYCGVPLKKANTVLEEKELNIVFDKLTWDSSVSSLDDYFNCGKKNNAQPKKQDSSNKKTENKKHQSQAAIL